MEPPRETRSGPLPRFAIRGSGGACSRRLPPSFESCPRRRSGGVRLGLRYRDVQRSGGGTRSRIRRSLEEARASDAQCGTWVSVAKYPSIAATDALSCRKWTTAFCLAMNAAVSCVPVRATQTYRSALSPNRSRADGHSPTSVAVFRRSSRGNTVRHDIRRCLNRGIWLGATLHGGWSDRPQRGDDARERGEGVG